jgi:hypothetical protein
LEPERRLSKNGALSDFPLPYNREKVIKHRGSRDYIPPPPVLLYHFSQAGINKGKDWAKYKKAEET